jgi:putative glycosyltransferase (TIGR04348 family)
MVQALQHRFMQRPRVLIISPARSSDNNGNWQTARRWQQMLRSSYAVDIAQTWYGSPYDVMLALHARRSAPSIAAWAQARQASANAPGLGLVLTGTDLYRDIHADLAAQTSLLLAHSVVVLQERGPAQLPVAIRHKARVIYQSTRQRQTLVKPAGRVRAVMVGHLRDEKSPQTLYTAARLLRPHPSIRIDHIGAALDAALGEQARATALACPHYRWLGAQPHEATRQRIQRAHVLVHTSRMEGGAHVVMEAICSGTPVLASRIDGNVGLLGADYPGYFDHGDAQALARLLTNFWRLQPALLAHCAKRASLFAPAAERAALTRWVQDLQASAPPPLESTAI